MDIATALRRAAACYPHRFAVGGPYPLTYSAWDDRTDKLALQLYELGARHGE